MVFPAAAAAAVAEADYVADAVEVVDAGTGTGIAGIIASAD